MRLILLAGMLFLAEFAFAEENPRFALVIGNAQYGGDATLANSANDANDVADSLSSIGWSVTKVIDGDRKAMNRAIADFRDALATAHNPTALLFYAGHGVQLGGQNYLIPVKGSFETPDDVVTEAVSLQFIQSAFEDAKVGVDIIILDACRDNPFLKKNSRSLGGSRGLSVVNKSTNVEGSAVLFSTAPGETASDGVGRNGIFTQTLLKYLKSDQPLQMVATSVTGEVRKLTGGKQTPYSSLSLSDAFYLVPQAMRQAAPAQPQPAVADRSAEKANLEAQKQSLVKSKSETQARGSWSFWLGIAGWSVAAVGGGISGYSYVTSGQALSAYNSSKVPADITASRNQVQAMNQLFNVGLGVLGVGLAVGVTSLFLGPNTAGVDRQIQDVDHKISQLGAP